MLRRLLTVVLFLLLGASVASGQVLPMPPGLEVLRSSLRSRVDALKVQQESEPEDGRAALIQRYQEALDALSRAAAADAKTIESDRYTNEAPALLEVIRQELAQPPAPPKLPIPEGATLGQIETLASQASSDLQALRGQLETLQAESTRRSERRRAITDQLGSLRSQLSELLLKLQAAEREPGEGEAAAAKLLSYRARKIAFEAEIRSLEREVASYDARREVLPARRDLAQRRLQSAEALATAWQTEVTSRRQSEAEAAAREAARLRRDAARRDPVLAALAVETERLADLRTGESGITSRIDRISVRLREAAARLGEMRSRFGTVRRRIDSYGLTRSTGQMLRKEYDALDDPADLRARQRSLTGEGTSVEDAVVRYEDERATAGDVDAEVRRILDRIAEAGGDAGPETEAVARELVASRRDVLDQLVRDYTTYLGRLEEYALVNEELTLATSAYRAYIEERILWVRSVVGNRVPDPSGAVAAFAWLTSPKEWTAIGQQLRDMEAGRWTLPAIWFAATIIVLLLQRRARRVVTERGREVQSYVSDRLRATVDAGIATLVLALPWPLLLLSIARVLEAPTSAGPLADALAIGLRDAAWLLLALQVVRKVVRPIGLGEAHFRWTAASTRYVRRHLRWYTPIATIAVALLVTLDSQEINAWSDSLGRLAFTVLMLATSLFLYRVLSPGAPLVSAWLAQHAGGWIARFRPLWTTVIILLPVSLTIFAWLGYYYTAIQLARRLESTAILVAILVIAHAALQRWLFVARRRVAVEAWRRRREQLSESGTAGDGGASSEDAVNIPAIDAKTRKLFASAITIAAIVGLLSIWSTALPALQMLDRVQVYPRFEWLGMISNQAIEGFEALDDPEGVLHGPAAAPAATPSAAEAPSATSTVRSPMPMGPGMSAAPAAAEGSVEPVVITLADIGVFLVVLVVTTVLTQNVPGLVEIVLLQRLPLDSGSRYAIATIVRYTILIVGIGLAATLLGVPWARVQWLVAALTFGLAFGLQEIFANFISGIIILIERPVRVGDTVTVGAVSGTVARIRMRATTVIDWDRKELILPNKSFITDPVVNWTLNDSTIRLIVPVGVSYSSDARLVERALLEIGRRQTTVLADPEPSVVFGGFGDSALNFELRVFLPGIDHLVATRHALHLAILERFRQDGIEISFPQRDLHIRTAEGLGALVAKREDVLADQPR